MKTISGIVRSALIAAVAFAVVVIPTTHAIEGESITLSPTDKHYALDPGAVVTDTLTIINDGSVPYTFVLYARPYAVKNSDYEPSWDVINKQTDVYSWVKFDKSSYEIDAGKTLKVPYTISVPKNASSGGRYGVIFAQTQPKAGDPQSVIRQKRVGSILYMTVNGNNQLAGELLGTQALPLQTAVPLKTSSQVKNTGNVDFTDSTTLTVRDMFGNQKYFVQRDISVLPGTTRNMHFDWPNSNSFGLYKVTIEHAFIGKKSSTTHVVLMIPLWLMALLVLIVLLGVGYNLTQRRRRRKKSQRSHANSKT